MKATPQFMLFDDFKEKQAFDKNGMPIEYGLLMED